MSQLDDFRNQTGEFSPESGNTVEETTVQDAAVQEQEEEVTETTEVDASTETPETAADDDSDTDEVEVPEAQKTAFQKALERERRKIEEKVRQEAEESAKQQYNPYKEAVEALGGDPVKIKEAAMQSKIIADAQNLAVQYGWDQQTTQLYVQQEQAKIKQQQTDRELQELRIAVEISELSDQAEYSGIKSIKKDVIAKVMQSNGALSAKEAFFALGGENRIKQMTRETEQRMIADRAKQKRVVQTENAATPPGPKPLDPETLAMARRMGLTEQQAREMLENSPSNMNEWRQMKQKKKA